MNAPSYSRCILFDLFTVNYLEPVGNAAYELP